jgi:RNA polymerase sigma-70 factor (ECF subfamily)
MATADAALFLRQLARGIAAETWSDLSDRQLVELYLARRDDSVFETILRRHGPMVYRVCWRVLQQSQDVEDAFQATFLLMAQRLRTLRKRDSLASWLHGVARRIALKARGRSAAQHRHEANARIPQKVVVEDTPWRDLRAVLDEELEQLPEKWRLPLVLCYLEGQTQDEAAARAGWSKNTLRRRLEEAREALGRRLKQRGVLLSGALASVLVSECATSGAASAALVNATVEAASFICGDQASLAGLVPTNVATLVEGVTAHMNTMKLKMLVVVSVCAMAMSGLGVGLFGRQSPAAEPRQDKSEPPATSPGTKPPTKVEDKSQGATPPATAKEARLKPPNPRGFSFVARIYQGDPLDAANAKLIDGLSGSTVPRSGGWFRIRQESVKEIDGEQVVTGYLMRTNIEPGEGGKIRLRLTLQHTGLEEDGKQETVVRTSNKRYDLTVNDGETVQLRFGKSAPADVWLQLRVTEDK